MVNEVNEVNMNSAEDNPSTSKGGESASIWWTIMGVVATGATAFGIGFKLGGRDKPCACKKPQSDQDNPNEADKG